MTRGPRPFATLYPLRGGNERVWNTAAIHRAVLFSTGKVLFSTGKVLFSTGSVLPSLCVAGKKWQRVWLRETATKLS